MYCARSSGRAGEDVGAERDARRGDRAVGRVHAHRVLDVLEPLDRRVLEDLHAQREAGALEPPDQARRVDQRRAVGVEEAAEVRRRSAGAPGPARRRGPRRGRPAVAHLGLVDDARPSASRRPRRAAHRCAPSRTGSSSADRRLDLVEVLAARRSMTDISSGQRRRPLRNPWVSEAEQKPPLRPDAPAPVSYARARRPRDRGRAPWPQRGPQPGVARADHAQVGAEVADEGGVRRRAPGGRVEPPELGLGVGEVAQDEGILPCISSNRWLDSPSLGTASFARTRTPVARPGWSQPTGGPATRPDLRP